MVSLRRKKYKKSFVGEKRRSARLLALDVVGGGKSSNQMQWKGNNNVEDHEEAYHTQEINETSNGNYSRNGTINQIIQQVLDVLELKDTHELFTMPDSMQIDDYTERVKNPSDFATLRQKNIDGMYTTLEQFENDVYTVFKKAITINDHNTVPYKQAIYLQDQAKQVLQSLKNNHTYSKLDISAQNQKHVRGRKKLRQNDETAHTSSCKSQRSGNPDNRMPSNKNLRNVIEHKRKEFLHDTKRYVRNVQLRSIQNYQTRKEPRLTYLAEKDEGFSIGSSIFGNQNPYLAFFGLSPSYQESLRLFTKDAGVKAQKAAEERCQMYTEKPQDPYFTSRPSIFPQIVDMPEFFEKGNAAGSTLTEKIQLKSKDKEPICQQQVADFREKGSENLNQKEISATIEERTSSKDNGKNVKNSIVSSSLNGVVSSQMGFGQYASLCKPFKSDV